MVHAYLVIGCGPVTLVDTGSGFGECGPQLREALNTVRRDFGERVRLTDIRRIVITHGHVDHFGGLAAFLADCPAHVAIHELDRSVLTANAERVALATRGLAVFLRQAGVPPAARLELMAMYEFSKRDLPNVPVDVTIVDGMELDGLRFLHTPGHCPGQVCIGIDDILLSADHVLPVTTPHQAPEGIMPYTGLGHYLESLRRLLQVGDQFRLALGGHEGPIRDLTTRIREINESHWRKLDKIQSLIASRDEPWTIAELSRTLYRRVLGFHVLLALEEVGAHVEYLLQRGRIRIANVAELEAEEEAAWRLQGE